MSGPLGWFETIMKYTSLSERRNIQLEKEAQLDNRLFDCYQECPYDVFQYLMKARELNRTMSKRIYDSSLIDSPALYTEQMDIVDSVQNIDQGSVLGACVQLRSRIVYANEFIKNEKFKDETEDK